jgi:Uma2 family endonuclease
MSVLDEISPPPAEASTVLPGELLWRFSVDQYHEMIRAGIFGDDDPVELLEGWLVAKMPKNPPHGAVTVLLLQALQRILPEGWFVRPQEPVTTAESEPEPDTAVIRGDCRDYVTRHPGPEDAALVIEVADSSVQRDSVLKKRIYARAGVPVYWIVNLQAVRVEVYTSPSGPTEAPDYAERQYFAGSEQIPVSLDGRLVGHIPAQSILP